MNDELEWLKEKIPYLPNGNWLYKLMCFILFRIRRKFTYGDYYVFLVAFHTNRLGEKKAREKALHTIMSLYAHFHNNEYPNFKTDDK